jgi:HAMP domain-containing protein
LSAIGVLVDGQQAVMKQRSSPDGLVRKTNYDALVQPSAEPPVQTATTTQMSDAESEPWNKWFDSEIKHYLKAFGKMVAEEFDNERAYVHGQIDQETKKLRDEIGELEKAVGELRAEAQLLQSFIRDRNVMPLLRGKDAA